MPRLRYHGPETGTGPAPPAIPFPQAPRSAEPGPPPAGDRSLSDVFDAIDTVSRRMEDLARVLGCLGYFDDDDGPRAA